MNTYPNTIEIDRDIAMTDDVNFYETYDEVDFEDTSSIEASNILIALLGGGFVEMPKMWEGDGRDTPPRNNNITNKDK